jgi:hypothetical protein
VAHEALQRFHTECKFADGEGPLSAERALAQAHEVFRACVFGSVDDPKVLPPAALDGRLREVASSLLDKTERLHDHPFATRLGHRLPPRGRSGLARRVCEVDLPPWSSQKEPRIGGAQPAQRFHVPNVILVDVHAAFRRQQMERREPQIVERLDRPAVSPISLHVALGQVEPLLQVSRQAEYADFTQAGLDDVSKSIAASKGTVDVKSMGTVDEMNVRLMELGNKPVTVDRPEILGTLFRKSDSFGWAMLMGLKGEGSDSGITMAMACAVVRVKQRMIFAYIYRRYESPETLEWMGGVLNRWTDRISADNQCAAAGLQVAIASFSGQAQTVPDHLPASKTVCEVLRDLNQLSGHVVAIRGEFHFTPRHGGWILDSVARGEPCSAMPKRSRIWWSAIWLESEGEARLAGSAEGTPNYDDAIRESARVAGEHTGMLATFVGEVRTRKDLKIVAAPSGRGDLRCWS